MKVWLKHFLFDVHPTWVHVRCCVVRMHSRTIPAQQQHHQHWIDTNCLKTRSSFTSPELNRLYICDYFNHTQVASLSTLNTTEENLNILINDNIEMSSFFLARRRLMSHKMKFYSPDCFALIHENEHWMSHSSTIVFAFFVIEKQQIQHRNKSQARFYCFNGFI